MALPHEKKHFRAWMARRFLLRVHMTFILGGTFLAGLAATKLLMLADVDRLAYRYGLAVVAAYLAFLVLIRLWLFYVRYDGVDLTSDGIDFVANNAGDTAHFAGEGGNFGGAGASGSWGGDDAAPLPLRAPNVAAPQPAPVTGGKSGGGGKWFDFSFDADELFVVILLIGLVLALFFAGLYILYTAPVILADAAFEAFLAAALARRAKRIDSAGWVGTVSRATVWPFLSVLLLSIILGWAVQNACPEAQKLRDAFHCGEAGLVSSPAP